MSEAIIVLPTPLLSQLRNLPGEAYNPLYIYGGPGLGKTHLMHSIGHFILERNPDAKIICVTSEEFTNEVIESIRSGNAAAMNKFREKYRTIDVLMIDDVQFIIGKESTQEEFFHTFNALHSAGKQIVLTSDKPPKDMEILEAASVPVSNGDSLPTSRARIMRRESPFSERNRN